MGKYNKPPLSYDKQPDLLASRGLIFAEWHAEMNTLLNQPVNIPKFYQVMGFLDGWKESPLWKDGT